MTLLPRLTCTYCRLVDPAAQVKQLEEMRKNLFRPPVTEVARTGQMGGPAGGGEGEGGGSASAGGTGGGGKGAGGVGGEGEGGGEGDGAVHADVICLVANTSTSFTLHWLLLARCRPRVK